MWCIRFTVPGICFIALAAAAAQEVDLKGIVRQAIDAHGGAKELSKFQGGISKYKGTMKLAGQTADVVGENAFQKPDKLRSKIEINILGKTIEVITVFDGKSMWVSAMGNTKEITDEKTVEEVRQSLLTEGGSGMLDIINEPYQLAAIGDVKVKGKDTFGIRVSKKGQRDINYYFDKKTHLLAKTESRTYDAMSGQEVTQEKFILEYQDKAGLKVGKRVEILKDGEPFMDIEVTDVEPRLKLDLGLFAKP